MIPLVGLSSTATCFSGEAGPRIVSKALGGQLLSPAGVPVPSFGDTIRYDDGTLAFGLWLPDEDVYWAMRFTPVMDCTLKEAHCAIDIWSGQAPTCTLIVWDDNSGEPGTRVFSTTFTPLIGLNAINITSPITYPESTDFWIGYFLQAPAGLDTTLAGADFEVDYDERNGVGVSGVWYSMNDLGGDGDLVIRAFVEYYGHDVGTDSITGPPDTVAPESTYTPVAWVHNYGIHSEIFQVECLINPGGYSDTFQVQSLAPGVDTQCVFGQWTVPLGDSTPYTMCVATLLPLDVDLSNDTLCKLSYAITGVAEAFNVRESAHLLLHQIVPNPFSVSTTILYEDPAPRMVNMSIYDATGRLVKTLVDGVIAPGSHKANWDGKGENDLEVPDGVYFCKLTMGRLESTAKLILIK